MISISTPILCGRLDIDLNRSSGKITDIDTEYECVVPDIIKNILNDNEINEVKDIVQSLYCKKCGSNLHYNTCGRVVVRELSNLTFK